MHSHAERGNESTAQSLPGAGLDGFRFALPILRIRAVGDVAVPGYSAVEK